MERYKKPMCDCGAPLFHYEEDMHMITKFITSGGKLSSRRKLVVHHDGAYPRLVCLECDAEYDVKHDEQKRIVRGTKWAD